MPNKPNNASAAPEEEVVLEAPEENPLDPSFVSGPRSFPKGVDYALMPIQLAWNSTLALPSEELTRRWTLPLTFFGPQHFVRSVLFELPAAQIIESDRRLKKYHPDYHGSWSSIGDISRLTSYDGRYHKDTLPNKVFEEVGRDMDENGDGYTGAFKDAITNARKEVYEFFFPYSKGLSETEKPLDLTSWEGIKDLPVRFIKHLNGNERYSRFYRPGNWRGGLSAGEEYYDNLVNSGRITPGTSEANYAASVAAGLGLITDLAIGRAINPRALSLTSSGNAKSAVTPAGTKLSSGASTPYDTVRAPRTFAEEAKNGDRVLLQAKGSFGGEHVVKGRRVFNFLTGLNRDLHLSAAAKDLEAGKLAGRISAENADFLRQTAAEINPLVKFFSRPYRIAEQLLGIKPDRIRNLEYLAAKSGSSLWDELAKSGSFIDTSSGKVVSYHHPNVQNLTANVFADEVPYLETALRAAKQPTTLAGHALRNSERAVHSLYMWFYTLPVAVRNAMASFVQSFNSGASPSWTYLKNWGKSFANLTLPSKIAPKLDPLLQDYSKLASQGAFSQSLNLGREAEPAIFRIANWLPRLIAGASSKFELASKYATLADLTKSGKISPDVARSIIDSNFIAYDSVLPAAARAVDAVYPFSQFALRNWRNNWRLAIQAPWLLATPFLIRRALDNGQTLYEQRKPKTIIPDKNYFEYLPDAARANLYGFMIPVPGTDYSLNARAVFPTLNNYGLDPFLDIPYRVTAPYRYAWKLGKQLLNYDESTLFPNDVLTTHLNDPAPFGALIPTEPINPVKGSLENIKANLNLNNPKGLATATYALRTVPLLYDAHKLAVASNNKLVNAMYGSKVPSLGEEFLRYFGIYKQPSATQWDLRYLDYLDFYLDNLRNHGVSYNPDYDVLRKNLRELAVKRSLSASKLGHDTEGEKKTDYPAEGFFKPFVVSYLKAFYNQKALEEGNENKGVPASLYGTWLHDSAFNTIRRALVDTRKLDKQLFDSPESLYGRLLSLADHKEIAPTQKNVSKLIKKGLLVPELGVSYYYSPTDPEPLYTGHVDNVLFSDDKSAPGKKIITISDQKFGDEIVTKAEFNAQIQSYALALMQMYGDQITKVNAFIFQPGIGYAPYTFYNTPGVRTTLALNLNLAYHYDKNINHLNNENLVDPYEPYARFSHGNLFFNRETLLSEIKQLYDAHPELVHSLNEIVNDENLSSKAREYAKTKAAEIRKKNKK